MSESEENKSKNETNRKVRGKYNKNKNALIKSIQYLFIKDEEKDWKFTLSIYNENNNTG
mgnify:CR=1 FL=1